MLKKQIEAMKNELDVLVNEGLNSECVYNLSVKLDGLIAEYYHKKAASQKH